MKSYQKKTIAQLSIAMLLSMMVNLVAAEPPYLGMGAKTGEVSANTAVINIRLSESIGQQRNHGIPGKLGKARIQYSLSEQLIPSFLSEWRSSDSENDYYLQYQLTDLKSNSRYYYRAELVDSVTNKKRLSEVFSFKTAPHSARREDIHFQVTTCQSSQGLPTYDVMRRQNPDFLVSAGDTVYYDKFDVRSKEEAYWLYQKDYGTPYTINYFAQTSSYFMKDDHDYRYNDADPLSNRAVNTIRIEGPNGIDSDPNRSDKTWLTHEEGIDVFKQAFPHSDLPYRTFRWGKGVQIWLLEGRDYRSKNQMPDGPNKTIWGENQKTWLKETLLASDADFRIIISPSPLIGPDKPHKMDNHANENGFMVEGRGFLDWMIDTKIAENTFLICGDRHWQYHSIYKDKVHEFCSGPTSQFKVQHVPKPEKGIIKQPYNGPSGGFLAIKYKADKSISFEHFGERGNIQNKKIFSRK